MLETVLERRNKGARVDYFQVELKHNVCILFVSVF